MNNKKENLIQQVIGLEEEFDRLITDYRAEEWLLLDLTINQLKSIIYIYKKNRINPKGLADALNVTPSVVTGIVDRLVLHGLVERKASEGSTDRRVQWLVVTDKGESLLDNIRQKMISNTSEILETMSTEDLAALVQGISAFIKAAKPYIQNHSAVKEVQEYEQIKIGN